ncbi:hypothetical protein COY62_01660 [bacterium (Candidatus Howlettbacteria) CG_4_10_14_0_8_um_filter_40_9]|nr:MAG: hypothetical protein COY62_01660 [bacterium (Candidatus Howlettbacteria) CG_4_10_14_0_8_um_filter_40_9]
MIEIILIFGLAAVLYKLLGSTKKTEEKLSDIVVEDENDKTENEKEKVGSFDGYLGKANRLFGAGAYRNAEKMFIEAIKINHGDFRAYKGLSKIYLKQENDEDAIASLEKVCQLNPDDDVSHNNLGLLYFKQKDFYKAKGAYEKAIALDKTKYTRHINLALTLKEMGDLEKATSVLEGCQKIEMKKDALLMLIEISSKLGDEKRKLETYKKLLSIDPDNKEAKRELARAE